MSNYYDEVKPILVSVDCIVFGFEDAKLKMLIGRRKMNPGEGEWSLYGGFVENNESLNHAAERTLRNLTGLDQLYMRQVGAFGEIDRDPGERVISVAYCSLINVTDYDDAVRKAHGLEWVDFNELPQLYSDHNKMVDMAIGQLRRHLTSEPLCFNLLPELFTLTQLQQVYEAILGEEIDKRNFRKRVKAMEYIEKTEFVDRLSSKRGAALFRFNEKGYLDAEKFRLY